jgi:outer membrane protein assembly factor BamB
MMKAICASAVIAILAGAALADWPAYGHDSARTAAAAESLRLPLEPAWVHVAPHPPEFSWPDPAKNDYWHYKYNLQPRVTYDRAFHVTVAGGAVFYGSSADDHIHCLDAKTGEPRWAFAAEGPVRLAPTVVGDTLLAGSDDGSVYCLSAADGRLRWQYRPGPRDSRILGDGKMISRWPIRTGVAVEAGVGYCAAGLFPVSEGVYLAAFDPATGREHWKRKVDQSAQGYLLASGGRLFVPSGGASPGIFAQRDGEPLGKVSSPGGDYGLVADDLAVAGPGDADGQLAVCEAHTGTILATLRGSHLVASQDRFYLCSRGELAALDRARFVSLARQRAALQARAKELGNRSDEETQAEKARLNQQIGELSAEMKKVWAWRTKCFDARALILAGDSLFVGGEGRVAAFRPGDGREAWSAVVAGNAFGLAVAGGQLFVSTDQGVIYCFEHRLGTREPARGDAARVIEKPAPAPPPAEALDKSLLGFWLFRQDAVRGQTVLDQTGRSPATVQGEIALSRDDGVDSLSLDGTTHLAVSQDMASAALPRKDLTAEAWVRIDRPTEWGGIIGAIQDNGDCEKGWLLGYRDERLSFAVAGAGGTRLTYLSASSLFEPGRWLHVAGTYDGVEMKIYVDGALAGSSREQSGPIAYPPRGFYDIGVYHDDNELYPLVGALHEVRVYSRALAAEEIRKHYEEKAPRFLARLFKERPTVEATDDGRVVLRWPSALDGAASVEYGRSREALNQASQATSSRGRYTALLGDLAPGGLYWYRILLRHPSGGPPRSSDILCFRAPARPFTLSSPYPKDELTAVYERAAARVLSESGVGQGFCLVMDAGEGRLAYEIAKRSKLHVVGVERDPARLEAARKLLSQAGVYGVRISLHQDKPAGLPYPAYFANLIASDGLLATGKPTVSPQEALRLLRPCGGVICMGWPEGVHPQDPAAMQAWLGASGWEGAETRLTEKEGRWLVVRRGPLAGAGEWTHGLADPGNTGCSTDRRVVGPLAVQWFGSPGPRDMADRHHRNVPPLYKDGRLFVPGDECVITVDAYNGAELWRCEIPQSRRLGAFLDCSNMAVDDTALCFVAQDVCRLIDVSTGRLQRAVPMPQAPRGPRRTWGYVACPDGLLVGSGRKPDAGYVWQNREADAALWYDTMSLVTSDSLFALDRSTSAVRWTYESGVILNTTIAIGGGRIFFVESHSPKAQGDALGRMPMSSFLEGPNELAALDLKTGKPAWKRPLDLGNCRHIIYLSHARDRLVLTGNRYVDKQLWYFFSGIEAASGKGVWERSHDTGYAPGGDHGEQNWRPAIVGDTVYTYPLAYNLHTGEPVEGWKFSRRGGGCGGISASALSLFWRGGNPWSWDLRPGGEPRRINGVTRTGCWINIIPAGGLLLIPEASSGCTCDYPLQTSIAYVSAEAPALPENAVRP